MIFTTYQSLVQSERKFVIESWIFLAGIALLAGGDIFVFFEPNTNTRFTFLAMIASAFAIAKYGYGYFRNDAYLSPSHRSPKNRAWCIDMEACLIVAFLMLSLGGFVAFMCSLCGIASLHWLFLAGRIANMILFGGIFVFCCVMIIACAFFMHLRDDDPEHRDYDRDADLL